MNLSAIKLAIALRLPARPKSLPKASLPNSGAGLVIRTSAVELLAVQKGAVVTRTRVLLDGREIFKNLRDDKTSLLIRTHIISPGKKQTVKTARFLFGKRHPPKFLFLRFPLVFTEHEDALIQSAGDKELLNTVFFGHIPEPRGKNQASFSINAMGIFAVEHHFSPL